MTLLDVAGCLIAPTLLAFPFYYVARRKHPPEPRRFALVIAAWIFVPVFAIALYERWEIVEHLVDPNVRDEGSDTGY